MLKKLRFKFVLINMGIVTAMLLVIFSLVFYFTKTNLDDQSAATMQSLVRSAQHPGDMIRPDEEVQLPFFVLQISIHGDILASGHTYLDLSDQLLVQQLLEEAFKSESATGRIEKYDLLFTKVSVPGGQTLIFVDVSGQNAALSALIQGSVLIGVASLILFLGISILLAWWAVKPVEKAWQQQKQFVSDASHELKTPLTVIMSNAELLQEAELDQASRMQFAGGVLTMAHQMRGLIEGMLDLARADNGRIRADFDRIDLSALVSEAAMQFEPVFYERQLLLDSGITQSIHGTGSRQHLYQVVSILLDNAAKYSDPGIVTVRLQRQGRGKCLLTVANPGVPIAPQDRERIFDRFYRLDQARTRTGSYGLGLAIAKQIVGEHNGKIWVQSNETGNCFCVELQCEPPEE